MDVMSQSHPPAAVYKLFRIDTPLMQRVQIYRHSRMLASEAEAFRRLIAAGLAADGDGAQSREMEAAE